MHSSFKEIIRFVIVGVVATLFNYGVYSVCILFTTPAISMLIATVLATILNYFMTTSFTFRVKRNVKNGIGFIITNLINLALNEAFLFLFIFLGVSERIAPLPMYAVCIPINFLLVRNVMRRFKSDDEG